MPAVECNIEDLFPANVAHALPVGTLAAVLAPRRQLLPADGALLCIIKKKKKEAREEEGVNLQRTIERLIAPIAAGLPMSLNVE